MASGSQFDRMLAEAQIRLPGALDDALKLELFSVLDEFFRTTTLWQESIPIFVDPDHTNYDIDSNEWVARVNELLWVANKDNIAVDATMPEVGVLTLYNAPSEDQTYTARVALSVADQTDADGYPQVPFWVVAKYRDCIKNGLIASMASQPAKPYYHKEIATLHGSRFRQGMVSAYADMKQQNTFNTQAWRFPQSFATSRRQ